MKTKSGVFKMAILCAFVFCAVVSSNWVLAAEDQKVVNFPQTEIDLRKTMNLAGQKTSCRTDNYFLYIPAEDLKGQVILTYNLPVHIEIETTAGVDYELTWRGDEIVGICPNSDFYPFYQTSECK